MFNMFPYVNLHKINLDWIITTVQGAVSTIQHSVRQIEAALDTVNGLTGRVNDLETSTQQLQEATTSLQDHLSHAETQITTMQADLRQQGSTLDTLQDHLSHAETQITTMQADLRQQGSTLDTLGQSVSALSTAVSGKIDNGGGTITGSANLLTVAGANSGEVVSIDGTSVTITGTGDNDVMLALDTAGEPGASESVLRLVRHDGTSPGPVRITNVGPGTAATDAVNMEQLMPISLSISGSYTNGTWTGVTWVSLRDAVLNGKCVNVNIPTDIATRGISVNITSAVLLRSEPGPKRAYLAGIFNDPANPALLKTIIIYDDNSYEIK